MTIVLLDPGVLVACKCDLDTRREVTEERGRELAASKDLCYFEVSAVSEFEEYPPILSTSPPQRDHTCVDEPFLYLASQYTQLYQQNELALLEMTSQ